MRLTDKCTLTRNGSPVGPDPRGCEFRHRSGELTTVDGGGVLIQVASAVVMVGPDDSLIGASVTGLAVRHRGVSYPVRAILPRYRPGGRLHHVSLELERASAA